MAKKPAIGDGDLHLVVDATKDFKEIGKLFDHQGKLLKKFPCLAIGNSKDPRITNGDTPPGLYHVDHIVQSLPHEDAEDVWMPFGEWFIDLFDDEGQERNFGRAGIAIHGGGSALGVNPGDKKLPLAQRTRALAPFQPLVPTNGCIRVHNSDLDFLRRKAQAALKNKRKFWVTVIQD